MCPIRRQYLLDCLRMVWWESVNRGSNVFSRTTWLPLGLQGWRQGRLWLECVYWNAYIRETVSGWRHVLWVATLAQWDHFHGDLSLLFLCRFLQKFACLFLLRRRKDHSIHPNKRVPLSLLYHPIKKSSNKFYQRALNIITFWWLYKHGNNFSVLIYSLKTLSIFWELTGQTIPVIMRISLLIKTISQIPNSRH